MVSNQQGESPVKPKTNAERQREFRARNADKNLAEVRGIFAHPDDLPAIKALADKLKKRRAKQATTQKG